MARKSRKNTSEIIENAVVEPIFRVAGYVRLSVEDSNHKGDSIETQKAIIEDFIAKESDLKLENFYIDNGTSGTTFQRIEFQKMLSDCESGKINCIITKDLSRLGRSTIDTGYYIEKYLPSIGVRYIAINDDFDTLRDSENGVGIVLPLKNMINEAYALDISRKIKSQQHQAMISGEYIGARPPYGYVKDPNNCHKLIVDFESAEFVKQIFNWANEGLGLNTMVLKLNELGIEPPSVYHHRKEIYRTKNQKSTTLWTTIVIKRILEDEVYIGNMVQGKTKTINHKQIDQPRENWICVRDTHEPIITKEQFEIVQKIRNDVAVKAKNRPLDPYTENIFKGKIFCGYCGSPMHRNRDKNLHRADRYYFVCLTNARKLKGSCVSFSTREDEIISSLLQIIEKQAEIIIGNCVKIKTYDDKILQMREKNKSEISELRLTINKNERLKKSLYENLVGNILTADDYKFMSENYENQIVESKKKIVNLERKQKDLDKQISEYIELSELVKYAQTSQITAEIINRLVDKILIFSDNKIVVNFKFNSGFEMLSEVIFNE